MAWIDLTPILTEDGIRKLEVGQVLIFNKDGVETHLKIVRKSRDKIWAQENPLVRLEDLEISTPAE